MTHPVFERLAYRLTTINRRRVAVLVLCDACEHGHHGGSAPLLTIAHGISGFCGCVCHLWHDEEIRPPETPPA